MRHTKMKAKLRFCFSYEILSWQVLGELLLDFLHLFGEDFDIEREGFSVRGGGFRFCVHGHPPHPQAGDPIVIEVRVGKLVSSAIY